MNSQLTLLFVLLGLALFNYSCKPDKAKEYDIPTRGNIGLSADETFQPILEPELAVFHSLYTSAHINVSYKTETDALNNLFRDSVRIIISSRELKPDEIAFFNEKKIFPKSLKIAIDAIALIVNPKNRDTLITVSDFRKVLTGQISNWNELDPKAASNPITVVFDNRNSSTVRYVLDSICNGNKISDAHIALERNPDVIEYVNKNPNAIGVIGVSWISDRDDPKMLSFLDKIKVMAVTADSVATPQNSVQPYQAYLWNKKYPLTRNIYVIMADPRKGLPTGFAAFLASERGQRIILKSGILPATQPYRIIQITDHP